MITITYLKNNQGQLYGMRVKADFLKTVAQIYKELLKGSTYRQTFSVNEQNNHQVEITGQVRSILNRKQGRVH